MSIQSLEKQIKLIENDILDELQTARDNGLASVISETLVENHRVLTVLQIKLENLQNEKC